MSKKTTPRAGQEASESAKVDPRTILFQPQTPLSYKLRKNRIQFFSRTNYIGNKRPVICLNKIFIKSRTNDKGKK